MLACLPLAHCKDNVQDNYTPLVYITIRISCSITLNCPIYLSGWVAAKSVRLYVDKNYRYHYLSILGHDPPENQSLETISGKMRDWDMDRDVDSGEEGEQKTPEEVLQYQEIEEGTSINCVKYWYCYYPRI